MPAVSWLDLDTVYRDLVTGRLTAVGWGAGGSFRLAALDCPVKPAWLIDIDPAKAGTQVFGIPVKGPDSLKHADPATTVVVIYSAYFFGGEIVRQLEALGPFRYVMPFAPTMAFPQLQRLKAVLGREVPPRPTLTDTGIVVQGAVVPEATELVLRYHRAVHGGAPLILSTWEGTDPALLDRLRPWCDRLVLNPPPAGGGQGNRNFQRVSTLGGIEAARAMGLSKLLKTRTDLVVMAPGVLEQAAHLQGLYGRSRLVVSSRYTQKYIPYNVSDIVLFGDTEDLRLYFSAPLDFRPFDIHAPAYRQNTSFGRYSRDMAIPEVYFAVHYLKARGHEPDWTLADYWQRLRDHWIVVDEEWFDLFWPKYGFVPVTGQTDHHSPRRVVDHYFWQRLFFGADVSADAAAVDIDRLPFDAFFRLQLPERGL